MSAGASASLRPGVRAALIVVGVLSLLGTVAALLYGADSADPLPGARDSYGSGALGHRAFVDTLAALGVHVVRVRRGYHAANARHARTPLVFLEPDAANGDIGGQHFALDTAIRTWLDAHGDVIVVLPKWDVAAGSADPEPESKSEPTPVRLLERDSDEVLDRVATALGQKFPGNALIRDAESESPRRITASGSLGRFALELLSPQRLRELPGAEVLASDALGSFVVRLPAAGGGSVTLISDPDLVHNFNWQRGEHASLWFGIFRGLSRGDTLLLDEVFHGHGVGLSLASALRQFPALLLVIAALFTALLAAWRGLVQSEPVRPLGSGLERGKLELIESSAAVLAAGQPTPLLEDSYVEHLLEDLADRFQLGESTRVEREHALLRVAARHGVPSPGSPAGEAPAPEGPRAIGRAFRYWQFHRALVARSNPGRR